MYRHGLVGTDSSDILVLPCAYIIRPKMCNLGTEPQDVICCRHKEKS